jgi:hypothetical protein
MAKIVKDHHHPTAATVDDNAPTHRVGRPTWPIGPPRLERLAGACRRCRPQRCVLRRAARRRRARFCTGWLAVAAAGDAPHAESAKPPEPGGFQQGVGAVSASDAMYEGSFGGGVGDLDSHGCSPFGLVIVCADRRWVRLKRAGGGRATHPEQSAPGAAGFSARVNPGAPRLGIDFGRPEKVTRPA